MLFQSQEHPYKPTLLTFPGGPLLEGNNGVTITVQASYEVRSGHTIALTFDAANVGNLKIDPFLETLIAPAILPRTPIQQMILLALKQVRWGGVLVL